MAETSTWSPPKTVIVTGGTGFVGTYVCRLLAENGQSPIAVDLKPFTPELAFVLGEYKDKVKFVECDLCSPGAFEAVCADTGADGIIHVAGYVGHEKSLADPARTYAVNVGGTVNVLEAARKLSIKKIVITATSSVYHKRAYDVFDEKHPLTSIYTGNPNAHYGASKMAAEQAALTYYTFHDLDLVVGRITAVYGFAMISGLHVAPLVEPAVRGEPGVLKTGAAVKRAYTHVEDTAAGLVAMLNADTRKLEQRVYNITRGELASAAEIGDAVHDIYPQADLHVGTELTEFDRATIDQRVPITWDAAQKAFGFRARYSIKDGVRRYAEVFAKFIAQAPDHPRRPQ